MLRTYPSYVPSQAFANTPVCCPSRATILTGRYPHNTLVTNNGLDGNCGSEAWRDGAEKQVRYGLVCV